MFISDLFRLIFRVKKMNNLVELCSYIRKDDLKDLSGWVNWRIKYVKDTSSKDEWKNPDVAIKDEKGDCEEFANIQTCVINSWKGWKAENLYIRNSLPGLNHAVTFWWHKRRKGIIDGRPIVYPDNITINEIVNQRWPTAKYYCFTDSKGKVISEKVYL